VSLASWLSPGRWCYQCHRWIAPEVHLPAPSLCPACHEALPWFRREICFFCGHVHLSGECREDFEAEITDYQAIFTYQEPISHWVSGLKYSRNLLAGRILRALTEAWLLEHKDWVLGYDLMAPVPIHSARLRVRGFNQTSFLVARQTLVPLELNLLHKVKYTKHQAALRGKSRYTNLTKSFAADPAVEGKKILLFDDVCTTGQTLNQLAYTLKRAGAEEVGALSLGRTKGQM